MVRLKRFRFHHRNASNAVKRKESFVSIFQITVTFKSCSHDSYPNGFKTAILDAAPLFQTDNRSTKQTNRTFSRNVVAIFAHFLVIKLEWEEASINLVDKWN